MKNILWALLLCGVQAFAQQTTMSSNAIQSKSSIQLKSSNPQKIQLEFKAGYFSMQYEVWNNESYIRLQMDGANPVLRAGFPEVLSMSQSVIVDPTKKMKVKVVSSNYTDYQNINLLPSKGNLYRDVDPASIPWVKGPSYSKNSFYPENIAALNSPYILRDYRAQALMIYPFQYNPVQKTLRVYHDIKVEIVPLDELGQNRLPHTSSKKMDADFSNIYQSHFANFSAPKYTQVEENGNMLIICHQPYMSVMQPFVNWKNRMGRKTTMVSVQSIGNNPDSIKSYISNYYNTQGLTYVLLVGDAQHIASKEISTGDYSDNWYGYLSGNDSYPELFVGRFSAETNAQVQTQVDRTIAYEMNPDPNATYYQKNVGIASDQGPGDDQEYDYQHIGNIQNKLAAYNYTAANSFFDGSQGGNDAPGNPTPSMVSGALNDGRGLVVYTGHGSSSQFVSSGFSSSHVALLNNAGKLPFIWSVACVNGEFVGKTCFAEYWLRSQNSSGAAVGAVATLMSTINQSWNPPMDGQDAMVDLLVESDSSNIKRTFGGLSMNGCMQMNDDYPNGGAEMTDTWTVFGDPSLMVRTKTPTNMMVSHSPIMNLGDTTLSVQVNDSSAFAALSLHDSLWATAYVQNGVATFHFSAVNVVDTFNIVVSAYNRIPYQGDVMVIPSSQAYINTKHFELNDSLGNLNYQANGGETIFLDYTLKNIGALSAAQVQATLRTNDTNVVIIDSVAQFGSMNAGDTSFVSNAFEIQLNSQIPDQYYIAFQLDVVDSAGMHYPNVFGFLVNSPKLKVQQMEIVELNGNGNGSADPNEDIKARFLLQNIGHAAMQNILNQLSTSSNYVSMSSPSQQTALLNTNANVWIEFPIHVDGATPLGNRVGLTLQSGTGIFATQAALNFRVGVLKDDYESGDFTQFHWSMSGNKPWFLDSVNVYEGQKSARSGLVDGDNNMKSTMQLIIKVAQADSLSFYKKISSEDGSSQGQYWDYLEFKIDNVTKGKWQGELNWTREAYPISAGYHLLDWTYKKDQVASAGSDCAWIDYVVFPPLIDDSKITTAESQNALNIFPNPSNHQLNIQLEGIAGTAYKIMLYDAQGRVLRVLAEGRFASSQAQIKADLSFLESGMYYVVLRTAQAKISRKFIKF